MRRLVAIMAVMGMLLHALAVVRHNGSMLAEAVASAPVAMSTSGSIDVASSLETDLRGSICHIGPAGSLPNSGKSNCPICAGLCPAVALPAPLAPPIILPAQSMAGHERSIDQRAEQLKRIRPASRGPPALA